MYVKLPLKIARNYQPPETEPIKNDSIQRGNSDTSSQPPQNRTKDVCPDALSTETCVQMDPNQERRRDRGRSLLHNIKGSYKYQGQLSKVKTNLVIKKTQTRI